MKTADLKLLEEKTAQAVSFIACNMESSCKQALEKARNAEDCPTARFALDVMCENADIAASKGYPVCRTRARRWSSCRWGANLNWTATYVGR